MLSAYQLPKVAGKESQANIIDPYVVVDVLGVPADTRTERTTYRKDQGLHPVWKHQMTFDLHVPALAVVRFAVYDHQNPPHKDLLVGSFCMRAQAIRVGLRTVPVVKPDGNKDPFARLFLLVRLEDGAGKPALWDVRYPEVEEIKSSTA